VQLCIVYTVPVSSTCWISLTYTTVAQQKHYDDTRSEQLADHHQRNAEMFESIRTVTQHLATKMLLLHDDFTAVVRFSVYVDFRLLASHLLKLYVVANCSRGVTGTRSEQLAERGLSTIMLSVST